MVHFTVVYKHCAIPLSEAEISIEMPLEKLGWHFVLEYTMAAVCGLLDFLAIAGGGFTR
ncbi:MAG TPA: hypothetical protein VL053_13815 [Arachidicoccus sp.]|nr:hypothetical protein [Arachidicoccus sp.]